MQITLFGLAYGLFIGLVVLHELGHLWAARRAGVKVKEFGLFFPPRLFAKKLRSGLTLSLNLIPLGGFVRLKGEHDADRGPGAFGATSLSNKIKITLAGVAMNLLVAVVLFLGLALTATPQLIDNQFRIASDSRIVRNLLLIGDVQPGSPAAHAGLKPGDRLISLAGRPLTGSDQLSATTRQLAGQPVKLEYQRSGQVLTTTVTLRSAAEAAASQPSSQPKGYLGVSSSQIEYRRATWSAPLAALGLTRQLAVLTVQGIWHALSGLASTVAGLVTANHQARENGQSLASNQVGGLVTLTIAFWHTGNLGISYILMLIGAISLTLAVVNLLPIPALDGGRLAVMLIFRALRRPLSRATEELIQVTGMVIVLTLIVLVTIADVHRNF